MPSFPSPNGALGTTNLDYRQPSLPSRVLVTYTISWLQLASKMLASARSRIPALASRLIRNASRPAATASAGTGENREQANDPNPPKEPPNVSKTNEVGVSAFGAHDGVLQESAQEGERQRQLQAPNRSTIWSRSQQPRDRAMTGPRFEQTIIEYQVSYASLQEASHMLKSGTRGFD
jgi:NADH dehydrogenase (ubiquinone) Fe-S protein 6